jgi:hypothetical protein
MASTLVYNYTVTAANDQQVTTVIQTPDPLRTDQNTAWTVIIPAVAAPPAQAPPPVIAFTTIFNPPEKPPTTQAGPSNGSATSAQTTASTASTSSSSTQSSTSTPQPAPQVPVATPLNRLSSFTSTNLKFTGPQTVPEGQTASATALFNQSGFNYDLLLPVSTAGNFSKAVIVLVAPSEPPAGVVQKANADTSAVATSAAAALPADAYFVTDFASTRSGLAAGTAAGIAIATALAGAVIAALLVFFIMSHRKKKHRSKIPPLVPEKSPKAPQSAYSATVDYILPQALDDGEIERNVLSLYQRIEDHVDSRFYLRSATIDLPSKENSTLAISSTHRTLDVRGLISHDGTRSHALKALICAETLAAIDFEGRPDQSLLPPIVPQFLSTVGQRLHHDDHRKFYYPKRQTRTDIP